MKLTVRIDAWWPEQDLYRYKVKVSSFTATKTITGDALRRHADNLPGSVPRVIMTAEEIALATICRNNPHTRDIVGQSAVVDTQEIPQ